MTKVFKDILERSGVPIDKDSAVDRLRRVRCIEQPVKERVWNRKQRGARRCETRPTDVEIDDLVLRVLRRREVGHNLEAWMGKSGKEKECRKHRVEKKKKKIENVKNI